MRSAYLPVLRYRATRPTGNWRPALVLFDMPFLFMVGPWVLARLAINCEEDELVSMTKRETKEEM